MRKITLYFLVCLFFIFALTQTVFGFENDIYKIEVPSNYTKIDYKDSCIFTNSNDMGITVICVESSGIKKDINTMSRVETKEVIDSLFDSDTEILDQGKDKLGKAKALKARVKTSDSYMDVYIVPSDKHVILAGFVSTTESKLDSEEFKTIKNSFVLKEKLTNVTLIRVGGFIVIAAITAFGYYLKNKRKV